MNLTSLSKQLVDSLHLQVPPVAVCLTNEVPVGVPEFSGSASAGCCFWELAAQQPIATSTRDHELCSIGIYTHNLPNPSLRHRSELKTVLKVLEDMHYVRPEDIPQIPVLRESWKHVVYAPLHAAPLSPDVVLVFAQANQGLVIAEAAQQVESCTAPALGRPACAVIPQVMNTDRAALSLGCCGARAYLSILTDNVALWGLPGRQIECYVERITELARANELLNKFHSVRLTQVQSGLTPTYQESMAKM
jgi:uncharacterized protein (DUF169 family)